MPTPWAECRGEAVGEVLEQSAPLREAPEVEDFRITGSALLVAAAASGWEGWVMGRGRWEGRGGCARIKPTGVLENRHGGAQSLLCGGHDEVTGDSHHGLWISLPAVEGAGFLNFTGVREESTETDFNAVDGAEFSRFTGVRKWVRRHRRVCGKPQAQRVLRVFLGVMSGGHTVVQPDSCPRLSLLFG